MAVEQPTAATILSNPSHSLLHRILAVDAAAAVKSLVIDSSGNLGINKESPASRIHAKYEDGVDNVVTLLTLERTSTGVGGSGIGGAIDFVLEYFTSEPAYGTGGKISCYGAGGTNEPCSLEMRTYNIFNGSTRNTVTISDILYSTGAIATDGNLSAGTSSPDSKAHIMTASAGSVSAPANTVLTLENNNDAYISILCPNNKNGGIRFGDPDNNATGYIAYLHGTDVLTFGTAVGNAVTMVNGQILLNGLTALSDTYANLGMKIAGNVKTDRDAIEIYSSSWNADMDGTATSIVFKQASTASDTNYVEAGKLTVGTETDWTGTASTQDSYLGLATCLDGVLAEKVRVTSAGDFLTDLVDYSSSTTIVGFSSAATELVQYKRVGKLCYVEFILNGTSDTTTFSFTLPHKNVGYVTYTPTMFYNASSQSSTPGVANMNNDSTTVNLYTDWNSGAWTDSGNKRAYGSFIYRCE